MKILLMTDMFPSPAAPISGVFLLQVARQLRTLGHSLRVICPVPRPPFPLNLISPWKHSFTTGLAHWEVDGFPVDYPCYWNSWKLIPTRHSGQWLDFCRGGTFRRIAKEFQPDLIWAQPALPVGWAAMKLSRRIGAPYVITVHGADINVTIQQSGARVKMAEVYTRASAVTAVSSRLYNAAREVAPEAKLHLISNGFEADGMQEAKAAREQHLRNRKSDEEIRVISVSSLIPTKGIQFNLQALSQLRDKFPQLSYWIVGDGSERAALEALTRNLSLEDRVRFLGWLPWREAMNLLAESDVMSLPSYREGFGVVYLEAMALGLPVIGVAGQGISDIIRDKENGLLTKPEDAEALTNDWDFLLSDKSRRDRIAEAGKRSALRLTWQVAAEKYDLLFRETARSEVKAESDGSAKNR